MAPAFVRELQRFLGPSRVFTSREHLLAYSYDATFGSGLPEVAVLPGSAEEVAVVLKLASQAGKPVFPRGAGTGLSGGSLPAGGVALSLAGMNRVVEINREDMLARVQSGVVTGHLQALVEEKGLFYPPDPGSSSVSTIGGNIAENASGPRGFKYGATGDYVLGLEAVPASGEILKTGGETRKNVTGYDLSRLVVGSEGTLAVVTEATLRLIPRPPASCTVLAVFDVLEAAGTAVAAATASPAGIASLEIMDGACIRAVEAYGGYGLPVDAEALVLAEVDGWPEAVEVGAELVAGIFRSNGATRVQLAREREARDRLWVARKGVSPAVAALKPAKVSEDATVPPSKVPAFIRALDDIRRRHDVVLVVFGHAGDGNLHPNILFDPADSDEVRRVERAVEEIFDQALTLGGTLSGEHGIGTLKSPYMKKAVGPAALEIMQGIKKVFDPQNILNPGKIFPPAP